MESCWIKVKESLKVLVPDHSFRMWIQPLEYLGSDSATVRLACPNPYSCQRVREHYRELLASAFAAQGRPGVSVVLEVRAGCPKATAPRAGSFAASAPGRPARPQSRPQSRPQAQLSLPGLDIQTERGRMLKKDYTFDHFVVGRNNDLA
jgi:chromosomal replication initiator protein